VRTLAPTFPLETERLLLRGFEPGDFDALLAIYSRPDVVRWLYYETRGEDEVHKLLEDKIRSRSIEKEGDKLPMAVVLRETSEVVGDIVVWCTSERHLQGEIGFAFHPDHQGHGYATEAAAVLLRLALEDLGLHRVCGRAEPRNLASARVMEKLGMRREADLLENEFVKGEWQSEVIFAMLDREWRETQR
jgi:RimJ/RimL family protein N-acetyltransferase